MVEALMLEARRTAAATVASGASARTGEILGEGSGKSHLAYARRAFDEKGMGYAAAVGHLPKARLDVVVSRYVGKSHNTCFRAAATLRVALSE